MRSETTTLNETFELIDIRGGDFDTLILSRGKPLAMNWADCSGSVAQYLVRGGVTDFDDELSSLRYVLDGNIDADMGLAQQLELFLLLLAPRTYRLELDSLNATMVESESAWDSERAFDNFYPFDATLVFIQPTSALDDATVKEYVAKIKSGRRPIALAITTEDAWCSYVIDGHHKLAAYRTLFVKPTVLTACRLSAPPLPQATFADWFPPDHSLASHYRNHKPR